MSDARCHRPSVDVAASFSLRFDATGQRRQPGPNRRKLKLAATPENGRKGEAS